MNLLARYAVKAAVLLWGVLLVLWLLWLAGLPSEPAARVVLPFAIAAVLAVLAGALLPGSGAPPDRRARRVATALFLLALAVRLAGLRYGLSERYNEDEGTYTKRVSEILGGEPFPDRFLYPHLVFYAESFAVWLAQLHPTAATALASLAYGPLNWNLTYRLVTRLVVVLASALMIPFVFSAGRRLGGLFAGTLAALAVIASELTNEWSHVNTCDVPSAFFASAAFAFAVRLLERESWRDYLLGGALSGLAAASKYPAGAVAVTIAAVWLRHRLRTRTLTWTLLAAAATSVLAFLAFNPALFVHSSLAVSGQTAHMFRGFESYKIDGWIGVTADNNWRFYLGTAGRDLGMPYVVLGALGLVFLDRARRREIPWLLTFPLLLLAVIASLRIVVGRNLLSILPVFAILLSLGLAALASAVGARIGRPRLAMAGIAVAALLLPSCRTLGQDVGYMRHDTRRVALDWMVENLPHGALVAREEYTPRMSPEHFREWRFNRFVVDTPLEGVFVPEVDFLMLSSGAYSRYFHASAQDPAVDRARQIYERLFATLPLLYEVKGSAWRQGPDLRIYRVDPAEARSQVERSFLADAVFVPAATMRGKGSPVVRFVDPGQWAGVKGMFESGAYVVDVDGNARGEPARVSVKDIANRTAAESPLGANLSASVLLAQPGKYFFYIWLPQGGELRAIAIRRTAATAPP